jgi:hypothetical protein
MKRYLNKLRAFNIQLVSGKSKRYELASGSGTPNANELFIGNISNISKGLFVYKSGQIYSLSHDDFSYDFLNEENAVLNQAYSSLVSSLPTGTVPTMPDEDGV